MATKKTKKKHTPVAFNIKVDVDIHGKFTYSADGIPDASTIRPYNLDTISWSARLMGIPVPFQIEFPAFGPFGFTTRVIRSMHGPTPPLTVMLPNKYHGNLVFKYTVSIANGWSGDPDVEPVPSDGVVPDLDTQVILLSIDSGGNLVLNNPDASFPKGQVTWRWAGDPQDDFTLKFAAPVPTGWPPVTASQSQRIALDLETTATEEPYTIETPNLGLLVSGKLTIS